jgi:MFS family permease
MSKNKDLQWFNNKSLMAFFAITVFYFFEAAQMAYYNVLAPSFLHHSIYQHGQIAMLSSAYYYGDMVALFPVGFALDHFPLRKTLIVGLIGSVVGAFLLFASDSFYLEWIARFICGLFGGAFAFLGGIRIIALVFPKRFTYFMGLFLAAGMFGGLICQYPLLLVVHHFGPKAAMGVMFFSGLFVIAFNWLYMRPPMQINKSEEQDRFSGTFLDMIKIIGFNARNWCDVFMVVLLDTPVSIIGTLWGIVFLVKFFHFSTSVSSWIVMALFAGLMAGLPFWGKIADKRGTPAWIIILGAAVSFIICLFLFGLQTESSPWMVAVLFFGLGFFSSCQSLGFAWLTQNMKPELIGRNSAFNSMLFMGSNGVFKQIGAILLSVPALFIGIGSAANLLLVIAVGMLVVVIYAASRKLIFNVV